MKTKVELTIADMFNGKRKPDHSTASRFVIEIPDEYAKNMHVVSSYVFSVRDTPLVRNGWEVAGIETESWNDHARIWCDAFNKVCLIRYCDDQSEG